MLRKLLMGIGVSVAVLGIGTWCSLRLVVGRPHWSSLAAIGPPSYRPMHGWGSTPFPRGDPRLGPPGVRMPRRGREAAVPAGSGGSAGAAGPEAARAGDRAVRSAGPYGPGSSLDRSFLGAGSLAVHRSPEARKRAHRSRLYALGGPPPRGSGSARPAARAPADADADPPSDADAVTKDPVCGRHVSHVPTFLTEEHEGRKLRFCSRPCLEAFREDPGRYVRAPR